MKIKTYTIITLILINSISCTSIRPISNADNQEVSKATLKASTNQVEVVTKSTTTPPTQPVRKNSQKVLNHCKKVDKYFAKYKWGKSNCSDYTWHHVRSSHWGNPIVWHTFGNEEAHKQKPLNTTMILCGVHGDEITPIKFCFDVIADLKKNPHIIGDGLVIVAPIVTPDSFFRKKPTRTNGRGIDVNRNFPTKDWNALAKKMWVNRYGKDKRRFPGYKSLSEQETIFQVNLIKRYKPNKIVSVHSPLTLIDYDGPALSHGKQSSGEQLLIQMSDKAGKYRVNNYPFFPGSLGNWAGNERHIPTYTLELPNSDWNKTKRFYKTLRLAIHHVIQHDLSHDMNDKRVTKNKERNKKTNDKVL
ncbi:MAG: hypothetical protein HON90_07055 [Halobacteriovoraceae bacterium]|jgi:murein peptide amidase A|nr:hypothetical protein [Halobacteriovoraceae bacterium]